VVVLSICILLEYVTIFPFPTEPDFVPAFYHQLGQNSAGTPQKIIDLPLALEPSHNNISMHYQTVHHQAMAGGHFIRKPAGGLEMASFLNRLLSPPLAQAAFEQPDPQTRLSLLNQFGFTKIVARPWLMTGDQSQAQLAYLAAWLGPPQAQGEVSVFEVPQGEATPPGLVGLLEGSGWQVAGDSLHLESPADLLVYLAGDRPQPVNVHLSLSAPTADRYLSVDIDRQPAMRLYLAPERLAYNVPVQLPPGIHRFTFRPEEACQQSCEAVNIDRLALTPLAGGLTSVDFDDQLALIKQELSTTSAKPGQPVLIYLYWQGQEPLPEDYSAFVHLVSSTGQLVTQADYLLGGWLYPTSEWPSNYITGAPTLFFIPPGTPPGEYYLQAGLYQADTGQRLSTAAGSDLKDYAVVSNILVNP
jgi:hypothetical protein